MTRLEANREILNLLYQYIERYPDQRFSQVLLNTDVVEMHGAGLWRDEYYKESTEILTRMRFRLEGFE
jgi:hypothetical protein